MSDQTSDRILTATEWHALCDEIERLIEFYGLFSVREALAMFKSNRA